MFYSDSCEILIFLKCQTKDEKTVITLFPSMSITSINLIVTTLK